MEILNRASVPAQKSLALSASAWPPPSMARANSGAAVIVGVSGMPSHRDPVPRTLIHVHAPTSLEQYARDLGWLDTAAGETWAVVLAVLEDEPQLRQWLERQRPRPDDLVQVATVLSQHAAPGKMALVDTLAASLGFGHSRLEAVLTLLANAGWVEYKSDWVRVPEACIDLLDRARALSARLRSLRDRDHQRIRSVSAYVIGRNCRHESMRRHFGTAAQRPCGICDNCRAKATHAAAAASEAASEQIANENQAVE
jgi:superfamily II DNA helicase RecQ